MDIFELRAFRGCLSETVLVLRLTFGCVSAADPDSVGTVPLLFEKPSSIA